jgi:hypothetical protein|tara:strand:- start:1310 stop:1546 length:237 start_codon:yes stop_codon:yes gene_type:complete
MYSIETAISSAIQTAEEKKAKGHLYKSGDPKEEDHDWSQGDPETVYSICSMYQDDENNDGTWSERIIEALEESFSEFF